MILNKNQTVREIAIDNPASVRVFENLGIDYCCGGRSQIEEACKKANVPVETLMQQLSELETSCVSPEEQRWMKVPLTDLTMHIVSRYHRYVREAAPRVASLLQKVAARHGEAHPELWAIQETFVALSQELFAHMRKEERVLFPFLDRMDTTARAGCLAPAGPFTSVEFLIARMLADHDDDGALTARIRELSGGYQAPAEACPSYRGLYHALEGFARDLHQHIHLENNVLFPRAVEMERSLQVTAHAHN